MRDHHRRRIAALAQELDAQGVDAFIATSPVAMGYLNGFFEDGHERFLILAVSKTGATRMICPALSAVQAERAGVEDIRPWKDGEDPMAHFRALSQDWGFRTSILAVDDDMHAHTLLAMQGVLTAALFKLGGPILANLMRNKDADELALMRRAAKIADDSFEPALQALRAGATEMQVEAALRAEMQARGGRPTFAIVATGAFAAEPHHKSDNVPIRAGDVVIMDFGCDVEGYQSDITRTVACGKASEEAHKVYDIVLRAHHAGRNKAAPGVACGEVDAAARQVIENAGYGDYFIHRTGHGIGMKGHEEPYIIGGSQVLLEPGHCFSVEPGIYLPGKFGVRIENIVNISETGCESQNAEPADRLIEVGP